MSIVYKKFISDSLDKDYLKNRITHLQNLKQECEEDIEMLKNRLMEIDKSSKPTPTIIGMITFDNWKDAVKFYNGLSK